MRRHILTCAAQLIIPIAIVFSQPASAIWGTSTTDHLVRLKALSFIKSVPNELAKIDQEEEKAKTDLAAVKKAENDRFVIAKAALIEKLKRLDAAIEKQKEPALRQIESATGKKRAELEALREQQAEDERALDDAIAALEADAEKSFWQTKSGLTQEDVDELNETFEQTKSAVEALEIDLAKSVALEPSEDLAQEVLLSQMAMQGIESQLDSLAKSLELPSEIKERYQARREAWKEAAVCMVPASHCKDQRKAYLKVSKFEDINTLRAELNRCAADNLAQASKATSSDKAKSCNALAVESSLRDIGDCIQEYRQKVLGKPETADSYKEYDVCEGSAPSY